MKANICLSILSLCALTGFMSGCATTNVDLVKTGVVTVTPLSSKNNRVQSANVYTSNGNLIVSGRVKNTPPFGASKLGHVDITIINPDGSILTRTTAPSRHRHRARNDNRPSPYSVKIPLVPPKGSKIQVRYHAGGVKLECESVDLENR